MKSLRLERDSDKRKLLILIIMMNPAMRSKVLLGLMVLYLLSTCVAGLPTQGYIALQAYNEQYVCAEGDGGVAADSDYVGHWEKFKIIDLGNHKVALQAYNGKYLCAETGGGGQVVANRDEIGDWEKFKFVSVKNNKLAIQACDDHYVCAQDGGGSGVVADRDQIGPWESFKYKIYKSR